MYEKESKWIKRSPNLPYLPVAYLKNCIIQQGLSIDGCCLCFFLVGDGIPLADNTLYKATEQAFSYAACQSLVVQVT